MKSFCHRRLPSLVPCSSFSVKEKMKSRTKAKRRHSMLSERLKSQPSPHKFKSFGMEKLPHQDNPCYCVWTKRTVTLVNGVVENIFISCSVRFEKSSEFPLTLLLYVFVNSLRNEPERKNIFYQNIFQQNKNICKQKQTFLKSERNFSLKLKSLAEIQRTDGQVYLSKDNHSQPSGLDWQAFKNENSSIGWVVWQN